MEKRIKTLYIITIAAILAFLGMQVYWLYGRYEFSLKEYERDLSERIAECVDEYNDIRSRSRDKEVNHLKNPDKKDVFTVPTFSLKQEYGDTVKTTRTAKISTYIFSAYQLLGLEPGTPLSNAQKDKAIELAQTQLTTAADSVVYDASGAKDENEAWSATQNVQTEMKCHFTVEGIDSMLHNAGIKARIELIRADSMVWRSTVDYHTSVISPKVSMVIPYSQLEGLTVSIDSAINPLDVLPGMWQTFVITVVISTLLIVCLILQFSTILKLTRLDRMRNDFVHTMIHELKRPISTLKMCVSSIENERMMADREIKREVMADCREALNNLSAYFSRLRDITFNEAGQIPLNVSSFSMRDMVADAMSKCVLPSGKRVELKDVSEADCEVVCDRLHLSQILGNLIENAVKYSGESVEIHINYGVDAEGGVYLSVTDNGNGIAESECRHLFDKFYRGKNAVAGGQPGMGLGLAYVKLLAEAHGGTVDVESKEGEGSCFTVKIPQS